MTCTKGDKQLGGNLHAVLDKIEADVLQNTKTFQLQMRVLHQSKCINIKIMYLMCQIPIKILEHHVIQNSNYQIIVRTGVSTPPQKHHFPLSCQAPPPLKSANYPSPPFWATPPYSAIS